MIKQISKQLHHIAKISGYGLFVLLLLALAACGSVAGSANPGSTSPVIPMEENETLSGDVETGRALFHGEKKLEGVIPCSVCHYVESRGHYLVGPNMEGISERAGTRVQGLSAADYLRQSIREPEAYNVEGFPPGTMNNKYDDRLPDHYVEDIIAYLMTL